MDQPVLDQCKAYASGTISRGDLVEFLATYEYVPMGETDGYDWLATDPPGSWFEVSMARRFNYIDESIYTEVFSRRHPEYEEK